MCGWEQSFCARSFVRMFEFPRDFAGSPRFEVPVNPKVPSSRVHVMFPSGREHGNATAQRGQRRPCTFEQGSVPISVSKVINSRKSHLMIKSHVALTHARWLGDVTRQRHHTGHAHARLAVHERRIQRRRLKHTTSQDPHLIVHRHVADHLSLACVQAVAVAARRCERA